MSSELLKYSPVKLDLPSEGLLVWEHAGFPQTDYGAFSFQGKCEPEALNRALLEAQVRWPNFHANLVLKRSGFFRVHTWLVRDELNTLEVRDFTGMEALPDDLDAWIYKQMEHEVDHVHDLTREYPARFVLFLLPGDQCIFVFSFHHVAADGVNFYDFLKTAFRIYHRNVTGSEPEWADVAVFHSVAGQVTPISAISTWDFLKYSYMENRKYPFRQAIQIASTPNTGTGRNMIRHIFEDPSMLTALRKRVRREGGTLSDLVLAASKLAIQEWNAGRGAPYEIMYHVLAVNQRLRRDARETAAQGNPMSGVSIPSCSEDRRDPEALLRLVIESRKQKMEQGHDIAWARMSQMLLRVGRLLPMSVRYDLLRHIFDMKISFFVTNLGVVWPRMDRGRPTGETAITRVGDMELVDIHSNVGTTARNPIALILRTFRGKLYMIFAIGRHGISDPDARDFSRLVVDKVLGYL